MATEATSGWLKRARQGIEHSKQWQDFTRSLFDAVQQQMAESHVNAFQDFSRAEKVFVLRKAAQAIQGGNSYKALMSHVSSCMENEIYHQIAQKTQEGGNLVNNKPDLFLHHLKDGLLILLVKQPELKGKLRSFLNQPLPPDLRCLTWRLHLSDPTARLGYISQLAANRVTSFHGREIFLRCEALLDSEPTFRSLQSNVVSVRCLANALSYYHKLQDKSTPLQNQEYFLAIPLLQVILDAAHPSLSVDSVSALLVEGFMTFMKLQPDLGSNQASVWESVALLLKRTDRDLLRFLESFYIQPGENDQKGLIKGLKCLLKAPVSTLFVGYLQMDSVLYVWDQIILGLKQPSYNCIPAFATAFLLLLKGQLLKCQSPAELEAIPKTQGPSLPVYVFQDRIKKHFFDNLYHQLHRENESILIHDPTQRFPAWSYRDLQTVTPPRMKLEDLRERREEHELRWRQEIEKAEQRKRRQIFQEEEEQRQKEVWVMQLFEEAKKKLEKQEIHLEEQLSQERQIRYEMQSKAEEQIGQLQAEINRLMVHKMPSSDTYSAGSLLVPAPSPESQISPALFGLPETDTRGQTAEGQRKTAITITLELLDQMMGAASAMVNGSNTDDQELLNAATAEHLQAYHQDYKNAKMEMFGYEIGEGEIDDLPKPQRKEVRKKLEAAVRRGAEVRYKAAQRKPQAAPINSMRGL